MAGDNRIRGLFTQDHDKRGNQKQIGAGPEDPAWLGFVNIGSDQRGIEPYLYSFPEYNKYMHKHIICRINTPYLFGKDCIKNLFA